MVEPTASDGLYDFSFMYTRNCNMECGFCMYDSSPEVNDMVNLEALETFISTIDFDMVRSSGFYGGEVSVNLQGFEEIVRLLPEDLPKFVITNSKWSEKSGETQEFLSWCEKYNMEVFVSGTEYHKQHQDREILEDLSETKDYIELKAPDTDMLPMGKLSNREVNCTRKCMEKVPALRLAVRPNGSIMYQTCDGKYPTVGNIGQDFEEIHKKVKDMRNNGFSKICPYYEEMGSSEVKKL